MSHRRGLLAGAESFTSLKYAMTKKNIKDSHFSLCWSPLPFTTFPSCQYFHKWRPSYESTALFSITETFQKTLLKVGSKLSFRVHV